MRQYALQGIIHAHEMLSRGRIKAASSIINVALGKIEDAVIDEVWRPDEINELKEELRFQRSRICSRTVSTTSRRTYTCMTPSIHERSTKIQPLRTCSPKVSPTSVSKELWKCPTKIQETFLDAHSTPHKSILKDHSTNTVATLETPKSQRSLSLARTRSHITKTTTTIEYSANLSHLKEGQRSRRRSLDPLLLKESSSYSSITLPQANGQIHVKKESWQADDEAKRIWRELKREMRAS